MQNIKISIHNRNLNARISAIETWEISKQDQNDILKFLDDLGLGKVNKGKRISETRQLKYLDILKIPLEYFQNPISRLTMKDIENFEKALASDQLKSYKNKPFASSTKADIKKALKVYLKWKLGDSENYRKLTDWLDIRETKRTPAYLSESEIELLYKACKNNAERYFIAVIFDSGARAEEFHNIRYEDIRRPSQNDTFPRITIKAEYSKTAGRTISLYWKHSLEAIRDYLTEREHEGIKSNDPVFKNSYDNMRQFLNRVGKKILDKSVHYHLFRHSSATYYASKLNRQELCYRYGWKFSSDMPDIYISRAGMENRDLDMKMTNTELSELQLKVTKMENLIKLMLEKGNRALDMIGQR
jgi:integrase